MSPHISDHWLVFVAEPLDDSPVELIAIPARIERDRLDRAPRVVLAAADAYRDAHPDHGVVFLAVGHPLAGGAPRSDVARAARRPRRGAHASLQRCASRRRASTRRRSPS